VLDNYGIAYEVRVLSAHRSPEACVEFVAGAAGRGVRVLVAGAGGSAHLAGVSAAHTTLPVIGVPLEGSPLSGFDALLSTVQMPPGIPVATVGVGAMGAKNAGHLAAAILALGDAALAARVTAQRKKMTADVLAKSEGVKTRLAELLRR
jgi:phosphoribosylamine--glycine ligase